MSHWLLNFICRSYSSVKIAMSTVAMIGRDDHASKKSFITQTQLGEQMTINVSPNACILISRKKRQPQSALSLLKFLIKSSEQKKQC